MSDRITLIRHRLTETLAPDFLEIMDEGHKHVGHPGAASGAGHYALTLSSPQFKNKTLLQCHKMVYDALKDLMHKEIHALKIHINGR